MYLPVSFPGEQGATPAHLAQIQASTRNVALTTPQRPVVDPVPVQGGRFFAGSLAPGVHVLLAEEL